MTPLETQLQTMQRDYTAKLAALNARYGVTANNPTTDAPIGLDPSRAGQYMDEFNAAYAEEWAARWQLVTANKRQQLGVQRLDTATESTLSNMVRETFHNVMYNAGPVDDRGMWEIWYDTSPFKIGSDGAKSPLESIVRLFSGSWGSDPNYGGETSNEITHQITDDTATGAKGTTGAITFFLAAAVIYFMVK